MDAKKLPISVKKQKNISEIEKKKIYYIETKYYVTPIPLSKI